MKASFYEKRVFVNYVIIVLCLVCFSLFVTLIVKTLGVSSDIYRIFSCCESSYYFSRFHSNL